MTACAACPVSGCACHGATGARPHFCALAAKGEPGALMLIRDVSCGNFDPPPKPALPGFLATARAFFGAAVRHVAAGMPTVTDEAYEARLAVCETCPNLLLPDWRCAGMAGCGCYLKVKARWRDQACPLGKWPEPEKET